MIATTIEDTTPTIKTKKVLVGNKGGLTNDLRKRDFHTYEKYRNLPHKNPLSPYQNYS